MKPSELEDMTNSQILNLLIRVKECFQKSFIRTGDFSTSIYFYNTKNSVNTYINIDNKLIADYKINLQEIL